MYRSGAFELGFNMAWASAVTLTKLPHLVEDDVLERHQGILEGVDNAVDHWHSRLPIFPPPYMTGLNDWHNEWLDNLIDGPYW
ncbi:MAG TPA: hypothetical protein EYM27_08850 [Dehalococcoidia bacterium]|nr:hypothetical protein [Dehalococcoidia bacterium]